MRDPKRIEPFLEELGKFWKKEAPDWRFGQLISNFCAFIGDPFFYEEDELLEKLKEFFKGG